MSRKVCVVITARPSYARIKTALAAIREHPDLTLQLVVAASALLERYGSVIDVIRHDGFEPDAIVYMQLEGGNLVTSAKSTGLGIIELATTFDGLKPDVVISIADRYETIATAIAASYMNIPVAHIQGGEVTGSIDEKVRHAVTKLANLHFVANQTAAERVIRMGEQPEHVYVTGCPSIDLAAAILHEENADFDPFRLYKGVGNPFAVKEGGYLIVMQHPVTTEHYQAFQQIEHTLASIRSMALPTFWFWPNIDAGTDGISKALRMFRERERDAGIYFFKNLTPEDFLRLLVRSKCLVGNSSVGIREASFLGVPVVNIGNRQQGRDRGGNVLDCSYDSEEITAAIRRHLSSGHYPSNPLYGDGTAGQQIADRLAVAPLPIDKRICY